MINCYYFQTCLTELFEQIFEIPSTVNTNHVLIDKINNTQDQVIKKGMIDPESQVCLKFLIFFVMKYVLNLNLTFCTEIINKLL